MAWAEAEHNEIVAALTVTAELIGVTYSKPAALHFLESLERYPAEVVLRALNRASKELSRKEFCLAAVLQLCAAEKRVPIPAKALADLNPISPEERKRNMQKAAELCAWLAGNATKPEWVDQAASGQSTPHWQDKAEKADE